MERRLTISGVNKTPIQNDVRSLFEDFSNFYASSAPIDTKPKCIIPANNRFKIMFDLFIMVCLMFTATVVPFRLAFSDFDTPGWMAIYAVVDISFLADVILTFFTSYTKEAVSGDVEVFESR